MPFSWMVAFLMYPNKSFRRKSWEAAHSKYLKWMGGSLCITFDGGHTWKDYTLTNEDIAADDWTNI